MSSEEHKRNGMLILLQRIYVCSNKYSLKNALNLDVLSFIQLNEILQNTCLQTAILVDIIAPSSNQFGWDFFVEKMSSMSCCLSICC